MLDTLKKYWMQFKEFALRKTYGVPNYAFIALVLLAIPLILYYALRSIPKKNKF